MPTTLTNGIQLPDKGSVDWYNSMQSNYNLIDTHLGNTAAHVTAEDKANWDSKQGSLSQAQLDAIAQVATNTDDIASLQSGKANASHTHSSSDITDIGDYATKQYVDNSISGLVDSAPNALDTLNELAAALNDDANFASTVTTALSAKANSADLATVATSGSYNDLSNKPTINDSTITIQKNGSTIDTFTTNGSAKTINIPVPTKTSDLTNDSNFVDTSNSAVASGITSAKVTDYDTHVADTDIHVTTADKNKWNSQTYVFRYSSTALVASSTNSNTLLDNTDNLKIGDKVIDSSGVLFSITAIDSVNSTFTIGSALIDLALDGNVVHTSGNETISGDKVFNNRLIKNIDVVLGTVPSTTKFGTIEIDDNNKSTLLQVMGGVYANGQSYARFFVQNKTADDGTGLSPTGTIRTCGFNINLPATSTSEGQGSITPRGNKTTDFGLSSYQWRNLWCEKLFLNGTQLDPSAFVTTDTAQTISGNKTFSSNVNVYNSDSATDTANIILKNSKAERGTEFSEQSINFVDKNNNPLAKINCYGSSSYTRLYITAYDANNNSEGIFIRKSSTGTSILPTTAAAVRIGNDTFPYLTVQTRRVNNLEPSSLSLPVFPSSSSSIDISSYITDMTGAVANSYTPPANGYITFVATGSQVQIFSDYGLQSKFSIQSGSTIRGYHPVLKNEPIKIYMVGTSIESFRFIPCQGNV